MTGASIVSPCGVLVMGGGGGGEVRVWACDSGECGREGCITCI